jgi:hypothetical protein
LIINFEEKNWNKLTIGIGNQPPTKIELEAIIDFETHLK